MEPSLEQVILSSGVIAKINQSISHIVKNEMDKAIEHVDAIFRSAFGSLNSNIKYTGYCRCRPDEEYKFKLRRSGGASKARYECARSDLMLVKYYFEIDGVKTRPHPLYIPFCDDTGLMYLRGTAHTISPVVEDPGLSITRDGCFFRVTCDRIVIRRAVHTYCKEELNIVKRLDRVQRHVNVPHGRIYRPKQNKANCSKNSPVTTLPHYLFARFGVTETFRRYVGVEVVCADESQITAENYPDSEWSRYYSAHQMHPNNKQPAAQWRPSTAAIAVRSTTPNTLIDILVAGYFYVADCYTELFRTEYSDEPDHWILLLGKMVFNRTVKNVQMVEYLRPHFASLDTYLDEVARKNLELEGIVVEDIYEMFTRICCTLDGLINSANLASMYGKRLTVLPYVLSPITYGVFYTKFALMQQCRKTRVDKDTGEQIMVFTEDQLFDVLNWYLKPEIIYRIKGSDHGEISSIAAPGDNKLFKITNRCVLQSNASRAGGRRSESPMTDESKALDVSLATCCSFLHITHPNPDGRGTLNLHHQLIDNKYVIPARHEKMFEETQNIITRRNI